MSIWDYDYIRLCGGRDANQDRVIINDIMIMVLDGHGSNPKGNNLSLHVVDLVVKYLPNMLGELIDCLECDIDTDDIIKIIQKCCLDIDEFIYNKYQEAVGGTTMSGILLVKGKIFVVNIGDSETIVVNGIVPIFATKKHRPSDVEESKRIIERGGFVARKRVNSNLAVSRVFGDYKLGKIGLDGEFISKNPIWAFPDVTLLKEKYTNIFIYSDGFGDFVDLSTLVTVAFTEKEDYSKGNNMSIKLAHEVLNISRDNITVISVKPRKDENSIRMPSQSR